MFISKFEIDGREVMFINDSRNTRHGFAHDSQMFIDGSMYPIAKQSAHYLNRTWERYSHETTMKACVRNLMEEVEKQIENMVKNEHEWKAISEKRRPQFDAEKAEKLNDSMYSFYEKILWYLETHVIH